MSQVNTELGLSSTATISLNQSSVRTLAGVPSGTISMNNLRGKSNQFAFTISSNQTNANLRTLAVNAGWNQSSKVVATINSGIYVSANSTGTPALTVNGSFPGGVELVNNGFIVGMGGSGGTGGGASTNGVGGGSGGTALSASVGISINNAGTIAGGGGGGGGGACGAEAFDCFTTLYGTGGGGGGGRSSNAANASGGGTGGGSGPQNVYGASGGAGTVSSAGSGGLGGQYFSQARLGGNGGNGGGWGASGSGGTSGRAPLNSPGGAGGGGAAVSGNGNITWLATGTRLGSIS